VEKTFGVASVEALHLLRPHCPTAHKKREGKKGGGEKRSTHFRSAPSAVSALTHFPSGPIFPT